MPAGGAPGNGVGRSPHPDDVLIREPIATGRRATPGEVERVAQRLATAPFDRRVVRVPPRYRGLSYQGHTLGAKEDALLYHLAVRVAHDRQWAVGTTAGEYVEDLHRAAASPRARIVIYQRHGGSIAAAICPREDAVPADRAGERAAPLLAVFHSADRGIIITGYQDAELDAIDVPGDARWLR